MDNRSFCNKCGFFGEAQAGGYHYRPRDGEPCNYAAPPAKPSTPSNEELTQRMDKAGVEAIALLRDMAAYDNSGEGWGVPRDIQRRIIAFLADLPKPVDPIDPDLVSARKLAADCGIPGYLHRQITDGMCDDEPLVQNFRTGIAYGRILAAGGTAHE